MPYVHWEEVDKYLHRNQCLDWMSARELVGIQDQDILLVSNYVTVETEENRARLKNFKG